MYRALFFLLSATLAAAAPAEQAQVRYVDLPAGSQPQAMAADGTGNLFIVSNVTEPSGRPQIRVLKTDLNGRTLASIDFGGGAISGAAVDPQGNVVIVGTTTSPDFPLVSPLVSSTSGPAVFITKLDSQLRNILFSTKLGGTQGGTFIYSSGNALELDSAGNIYVTGGTSDKDFPITPGAFQSQPPQSDPFGSARYAFLTEISADGRRIVFSTYFGDSKVGCIGGSHCIGAFGNTYGSAIAVDPSGDIVIAGSTTADQLQVTSGVYAQQCGCTSDSQAGFLAKFAAGGSKLIWASYLPPVNALPFSQLPINGMALDSAENVIIGGTVIGADIPVTNGALQPVSPGGNYSAGFVLKFDSAASRLLFSTYFGAPTERFGGLNGLLLDPAGTIWITGNSTPAELPIPNGTALLGPAYLAGLTPDGSAVTSIFTAPSGTAGLAISTTAGNVIALGQAASLLIASPGQGPSLVAVANAAGPAVSNAVAPYELVSLYGLGIGPTTPANAQVVNGVVTTSLSDVQVLFDGIPAPLLYVGSTQINAVVPSEVMGQDSTTLQITTPAGTVNGPTMLIRPTQPGVFVSSTIDQATTVPYAAALNQDGSVNSATNPAAYGSIVSIWATGGQTSLPSSDGAIATGASGGLFFPVSILASYSGPGTGMSLEVLYAGDAPGMVAGVSQVNFRLPELSPLPITWAFQLQIGDALSQPFEIYLAQ